MAFLVLLLLIFGVKGCLNARHKQAIKDYVQDVSALTDDSNQQGTALFRLLNSSGGRNQAVDIENTLNGFRVQSAQLVDRAKDISRPDDMKGAQNQLIQVLEFRRDGLAAIADALRTALGDANRRQGTNQVTAQMQAFLTSDVIYTQRVVPGIQGVLGKQDLENEVRIPRSQFLPDIQWLQPSFVADRVTALRTGRRGGAAAPGLHGDGLGTVSLGGQALTPGGGAATVRISNDLKFDVQVVNQGNNTETDVLVRVTIGSGGDAIKVEKTLDTIAAGETKTVSIPLADQPPTGQNVPVTVQIEPVPGEQKTDNNRQQFSAIFTR